MDGGSFTPKYFSPITFRAEILAGIFISTKEVMFSMHLELLCIYKLYIDYTVLLSPVNYKDIMTKGHRARWIYICGHA